jgi:hypothetical protein
MISLYWEGDNARLVEPLLSVSGLGAGHLGDASGI